MCPQPNDSKPTAVKRENLPILLNLTIWMRQRTRQPQPLKITVFATIRPQPIDNKSTASRQQADTTNNNNKNNKNNNIYSDEPKLDTAVKEFITFRKKIKKPMTDHAVKLMLSKLNKLTSDIDEQVEILNQSILNGWQGIYPLKREENKRGQNGIAIDESKDDLDDLF